MLAVLLTHRFTQIYVTNAIPAAGSPVPVRPAVIDLSEFAFAMSSPHGGRLSCEYGTLTLRPSFFSEMAATDSAWWPPPALFDQIEVSWYPDDGSTPWTAPEALIGWLESWDSTSVVYSLRPRTIYGATTMDHHYQGTLVQMFTAAAATLGMLLNTGMARSPSPDVDWLAEGEQEIFDNLDALCRYTSHWYHVRDATIYLVDLLATKPSTSGYGPADFASIAYLQPQPLKRLTAPWQPLYIRALYLEITDVGNAYGKAIIVEMDVALSVNGPLINPGTLAASISDPGHPASHAMDDSLATYWSSGDGAVPGVGFSVAIGDGNLVEYAITAGYDVPDYAPTGWRLYGYNVWGSRYEYLGEVEAVDWQDGLVRRFRVPTPTWQVTRDVVNSTSLHDHSIGGELAVAPCHSDYYYIANALQVIESVVTRPRTRVVLPIRAELQLGFSVLYNDPTIVAGRSVESWLRIDSITYDFTSSTMVIEGYGGWA